ncbi:MAG TPA: tRNA (N6-isopentenyl adenosine(37)-C2)-methylthiotransferase MiaB [Bacteroidales bacterium]|nr:tRNA (N6-isopentenyl adenosine(37)-C2)-methylthiotransferase MiaB [Bacteroidales bacterium]
MKKIFIETYGCQMNFSDSEIVASILCAGGYEVTQDLARADVIFLNTCSIREHAEKKIRNRLHALGPLKRKRPGLLIGLLGCMAERLKEELLEEEEVLDLVAGPDSYRQLPLMLDQAVSGIKGVNTLLSVEETYGDISPVRYGTNGVSAFISIMRGCGNHCAYCVVPQVRGRERSRDIHSIIKEATELFESGYREITLLGQNVNSYRWDSGDGILRFPEALQKVARVNPRLRVRFATSHPKDLSDELIEAIAVNENLCRSVHLPVQSGSNAVLARMNRRYTREHYLERVEAIRRKISGCTVTTDIITGFCGETEEEHLETLSLMEQARFDAAFMFRYSERPDTPAARKYPDDVPDGVKERRLKEIIALQHRLSLRSNRADLNREFEVLIEGDSRRSAAHFSGRNSQNKMVVFPKNGQHPGEYVRVTIRNFTSATLIGELLPA